MGFILSFFSNYGFEQYYRQAPRYSDQDQYLTLPCSSVSISNVRCICVCGVAAVAGAASLWNICIILTLFHFNALSVFLRLFRKCY